jgi:hypothetical protein
MQLLWEKQQASRKPVTYPRPTMRPAPSSGCQLTLPGKFSHAVEKREHVRASHSALLLLRILEKRPSYFLPLAFPLAAALTGFPGFPGFTPALSAIPLPFFHSFPSLRSSRSCNFFFCCKGVSQRISKTPWIEKQLRAPHGASGLGAGFEIAVSQCTGQDLTRPHCLGQDIPYYSAFPTSSSSPHPPSTLQRHSVPPSLYPSQPACQLDPRTTSSSAST